MEDDKKYFGIMDGCPYKSITFRFFWLAHKIVQWPYYFFLTRIKLRKLSGLHGRMEKCERVDLFSLNGKERGFMLVLDNRDALYFYQDGDHFKYDGCETGQYENGDVTIFDNIEN